MKTIVYIFSFTAILAALALAGCSSPEMHAAQMDSPEHRLAQIEQREHALAMQESKLNDRAVQLSQQEQMIAQRLQSAHAAEAETMKMQTMQEKSATMASMDQTLLPPKAQSGQCFARVFVPPTYETVTQKMLKHEASEKIEIIPAKYETVTERIISEEASERLETIPAKYAMVDEKVMVKPETSRLINVPARYAKTSEKVLVTPAHQVWKKGVGPIQKIDEATGEIMCLVDIPAEYRNVSKTVLQTPATTQEIIEPAVYKTVQKRVMIQPPMTKVVKIPAKYETVSVTKLVSPAQEKKIIIPATYQMVSKQIKTSEGQMEWREILCQTNMTRDRISDIQRALQAKGFDPGPIDGIVGTRTMAAVHNFQKSSNLPTDKYLNVATIKALGVSPR
jgi:outer membrane murein-binding lipoprotein Lpp